MTDPALQGFGLAPAQGASNPAAEAEEPHWIAAQATLNYQTGGQALRRGETYLVNLTDPETQRLLAHGFITPLPEAQQPKLRLDQDGNPTEA